MKIVRKAAMVSGKNRLALLLPVDVDFISIATRSIRLLLLDVLKKLAVRSEEEPIVYLLEVATDTADVQGLAKPKTVSGQVKPSTHQPQQSLSYGLSSDHRPENKANRAAGYVLAT